jgi:hypothetical protein
MSSAKQLFLTVAAIALLCPLLAPRYALAELHWQATKKEHMRIRLIALASNYPRSSFFPNQEVFVAEKELGVNESRLVKLVYGYLPYQPRLSDQGLNYTLVHEMTALRDPNCDETLSQMTSAEVDNWKQTTREQANHDPANHVQAYAGPIKEDKDFKYSANSPVINLDRRRAALPCYVTTAEDYSKGLHQIPSPDDRP